jgi:hypothetical protein
LLDPLELIVASSTGVTVLDVFTKGGEVPGRKLTIQELVNSLKELVAVHIALPFQ